LEYRILLCTGGPAVQITGNLSSYNEPAAATLQHQDWFLPWTDYPPRKTRPRCWNMPSNSISGGLNHDEPAHTPGPWHVDQLDVDLNYDSEGNHIATAGNAFQLGEGYETPRLRPKCSRRLNFVRTCFPNSPGSTTAPLPSPP
jgi:hypothetical protein